MRLVLWFALFASALRADLTLRYKTSFEIAPNLPAEISEGMKKQMLSSLPPNAVIRIRGSQFVSMYGEFTLITDFVQQQITLLHPPSKRYAVARTADVAQAFLAVQPLLPGIEFQAKAGPSGKTAVIHQVPAEETVVTITISTPTPDGPPVEMRMELHNWIA